MKLQFIQLQSSVSPSKVQTFCLAPNYKDPQSTFFAWGERMCLTPIENMRQIVLAVCLIVNSSRNVEAALAQSIECLATDWTIG
jgi:hypothetical protein